MKRLYHLILLVSISVITFNCQKEVSYSGPGIPGTGNNNTDPITATLQGNIEDETGQPAAGVMVRAGNKTATTNARGFFRITNASLDKKASLVTAEKAGYFKAYRSFNATSGANYIKIKLTQRMEVGNINATAGGTATLSNGAKVALPANGIVKASGGAAYTGNVKVYAAYIDPTAVDIAESVPGSFVADDKNNKRVVLTSYGMLAVELESDGGEKLQIAPGTKATLTTPIPASIQSSAPSTIALWYVDETTGIWKEKGVATKNGNNYVGDVSHFSFWNCDVSANAVILSVTLKTNEGVAINGAFVRLTLLGNGWTTTTGGFTDSLGQVSGWIPGNQNLKLEVLDPCYNIVYTQNIGPYNQNTNLGVITINNPASPSLLTIKGRLKDCSNAIVTNGYVLVSFENISYYIGVNSAGEFSLTFMRCPTGPGTAEILGVDAAAQQQGPLVSVLVNATGVTNAGDISACGNSASQYINYILNGTNYSISSTSAGDSLTAYTSQNQGTPPLATWVSGWKISNNDNIFFSFSHNAGNGTYTVNSFATQNFDSLTLIQPFNVILTNYPATIGGFYEGTFSGQFKETGTALPVHNINGSFRVRRMN